ncbi:MTH1187 family thiamine-binding protein [Candidatus Poribacteria bacterium]|jgi:uncharacterized protein (TIGR00106 family)|nr:MTH1187 family thiamine-binding protein [Candidatus Poribacteria bacterium]MBT5536271.1 MTH1187 family thiamine-binding protein [Candidatus Poribacteria bacterium]MBT7100716.1 MTH1187 family thiamine-binding protein [Candidatus Poribacteria bacterium]MBT7806601.1 MTH1187 family thiamine-binding protein [Candidatus Poribacteria bacterium]
MHVIADICIVPMGVGASVSTYVTTAYGILRAAGLNATLHAYGTNVEGSYEDVMAALKRCHEALHAAGAPRLSTTIRLGTRVDKSQTMADKVRVVVEAAT